MADSVTITLTTGLSTGPFSLYSNLDGYTTPFETGVTRASLVAGYTSVVVPTGTTIVRVTSTGVCTNSVDLTVTGITTTTTTTTTAPPTSTTTTTTVSYVHITSPGGNFFGSNTITCTPSSPVVNVYLNGTDYTTWLGNGNVIATGMTIYSSAGVLASYTRLYDPTPSGIALPTIFNLSSGIVGTVFSSC